MVAPLFSAATAANLKTIRSRGYATARLFFADTYVLQRLTRGTGWDDGTTEEDYIVEGAGVGRLYGSGSGLPQFGDDVAGEDVIVNLTPYRFRMDRDSSVLENDRMIVNGREFFVKDVVRGDSENELMWVSLSERST